MFPSKHANAIYYGLLGMPLAMLGIPVYLYLPTYYATNFGISLSAIGLALLLSRSLDVVTDPLIGQWSDRLAKTVNRKLQIAFGALLLSISLYFLFLPQTQTISWWYVFIFSFVTYQAWTIMQVPYLALSAESTPQGNDKNLLTSYRESAAIFGVMLLLVLPVISGFDVNSIRFYELFLVLWLITSFLSLTLLIYFSSVQRPLLPEQIATKTPVFFTHLKQLKQQQPQAFKVMPAYFFNNLANAIPATLFILFVSQYLQLEQHIGLFLITYFLAGVITLPVWVTLANTIGKTNAWKSSIALASISFSGVFLLESGDFSGYLIICILTGASLGVDIAMPASIQAEIAENISRVSDNVNGLLFGLWGMLTKLALALAVGITLPLIDLATAMQWDSDWVMLLLYAGLPIIIKAWVYKSL